MKGISPNIITHKLHFDPTHMPVKQKPWRMAPYHAQVINEEVERLLEANTILEVQYPKWLSNTVYAKKKGEKWRVCIDFTDLNKACPKDDFPLPKVDQLVDATMGH